MMRSITLIAAIMFLMIGCLAGCDRASPRGAPAENLLPVRAAQQAADAKAAAYAIDVGAAEDALYAVERDLHGSDFSQLGSDAEHLRGLPPSDLSTNVLWQRHEIITNAAYMLLNNWAKTWVNITKSKLLQTAADYASNDTSGANDRFKVALGDVTEDAIRGQTCQDILNDVAPDPNPTATNEPDDENWQGDIKKDAAMILATTFKFNGIDQVMKWNNWYNDVSSSARKASQAILNNPTPYLNILSNPAGWRATYVYVKYCYAPPTDG